jgi:hypothetical protein
MIRPEKIEPRDGQSPRRFLGEGIDERGKKSISTGNQPAKPKGHDQTSGLRAVGLGDLVGCQIFRTIESSIIDQGDG